MKPLVGVDFPWNITSISQTKLQMKIKFLFRTPLQICCKPISLKYFPDSTDLQGTCRLNRHHNQVSNKYSHHWWHGNRVPCEVYTMSHQKGFPLNTICTYYLHLVPLLILPILPLMFHVNFFSCLLGPSLPTKTHFMKIGTSPSLLTPTS